VTIKAEKQGSKSNNNSENQLSITAEEFEEQSPNITSAKQAIFGAFNQIEKLYASKGSVSGLRTGFKDLDRLLDGLHHSNLIVLAARPSMGKSSLALNIAAHVTISEKKPALYVNLAESKDTITSKLLTIEAAIDSQRLAIGELEEKDWIKLVSAGDRLAGAPLSFFDAPIFDKKELLDLIRTEQELKQYSLIIIDYIQLINGSEMYAGNRVQEISDIGRSLKQLAAELKIPILALSQLSRSVESRQVKKPLLSDIRDSGSLEEDADIVMFLYRDDYYNLDSDRKNITEIIVAKNRSGPLDTVQLFFHKQFSKFSSLTKLDN
jgi:replicative DNA helicase